jgi:16S rRNA (uracil1498-N3)-methyltransferase
VLRVEPGESIALFNGTDGEWLARVETVSKRDVGLVIDHQLRVLAPTPPLWVGIPPIKKHRLDFMLEKATELGATRITPLLTDHVGVSRVRADRWRVQVIEASEQCERLDVPQVDEQTSLADWLSALPEDHAVVVALERAPAVTRTYSDWLAHAPVGPISFAVGPEGGFSTRERSWLIAHQGLQLVDLGSSILRTETALLSLLAGYRIVGAAPTLR